VTLRIGTRGSALALAQAGTVAAALRARGAEAELVSIRTEGDRLYEARLADVGGKGLFVREIEEALLAGQVDLAVHSLKDLPAEPPPGLALAAFPRREDPRDVLVSRAGGGIGDLPRGATVATSSPRRRALLRSARPDLVIEPMRGNVDTRLRKLEEGDCQAIVLAAAGLARLKLTPPHAEPLEPEDFVPAVGQGILAIETRADDRAVRDLVAALDDAETRACALAERAYLRRLGGTCNTPLAAHAMMEYAALRMVGVVLSEDGSHALRDGVTGSPEDAEEVGRWLAESLLAQGAAKIAPLTPPIGGR
jgi:hydroxymethylbilane synthase